MGVLDLFFFRAISLIAFLHNRYFSFLREAVVFCMKSLSGWVRWLWRSRCCGSSQNWAPRSSQGAPKDRGWLQQGLGALPVGRDISPLGSPGAGPEPPLQKKCAQDPLTFHQERGKFPLLVKSPILRIKFQEFIFHEPNKFLFSCLPTPHWTVLDHPTQGRVYNPYLWEKAPVVKIQKNPSFCVRKMSLFLNQCHYLWVAVGQEGEF